MPRRIVDISVALKAGIISDPPHALPKIEYLDHHMTAPGAGIWHQRGSIARRPIRRAGSGAHHNP